MKLHHYITTLILAAGLYEPLSFLKNQALGRESAEITQSPKLQESHKVKAVLFGRERDYESHMVLAEESKTAAGMLNQIAVDSKGASLAAVEDIIIDANGRATTIVFSEGGFYQLGAKLGALDYELATEPHETEGDSLKPLSEEAIDSAFPYSYKPVRRDRSTQIMPADCFKLSNLLDADVLDPEGSEVAEIDNAILRSGQIAYLILGVDKALGLGGKQIAIPYKALTIAGRGEELNGRLTSEQAEKLKILKTQISSR